MTDKTLVAKILLVTILLIILQGCGGGHVRITHESTGAGLGFHQLLQPVHKGLERMVESTTRPDHVSKEVEAGCQVYYDKGHCSARTETVYTFGR
jgi:hypothetical protein